MLDIKELEQNIETKKQKLNDLGAERLSLVAQLQIINTSLDRKINQTETQNKELSKLISQLNFNANNSDSDDTMVDIEAVASMIVGKSKGNELRSRIIAIANDILEANQFEKLGLKKAFEEVITAINAKYSWHDAEDYKREFHLNSVEEVKAELDGRKAELIKLGVDISKHLGLINHELVQGIGDSYSLRSYDLENAYCCLNRFSYQPAWVDFNGRETIQNKINEILDDRGDDSLEKMKDCFDGVQYPNHVIQNLTTSQQKLLFKTLPVHLIHEACQDWLVDLEAAGTIVPPDPKKESKLKTVLNAVCKSNPERTDAIGQFIADLNSSSRYRYEDGCANSDWADCWFSNSNKCPEITEGIIPF